MGDGVKYDTLNLWESVHDLRERIEALERHADDRELHWQEFVATPPPPDHAAEQAAYERRRWEPIEDVISTLSTPPATGEAIPQGEYLRRMRETNERKPRTWWINMYPSGAKVAHESRQNADVYPVTHRLECVEVREVLRDENGMEVEPDYARRLRGEIERLTAERDVLREFVEAEKNWRTMDAWSMSYGCGYSVDHPSIRQWVAACATACLIAAEAARENDNE